MNTARDEKDRAEMQKALDELFAIHVAKAVDAEREACARVADDARWHRDFVPREHAQRIAAEIRARSK